MVNSQSARLDTVFGALSDPTRRAMLKALTVRRSTVGELAAPFAISLAAASKHIQVLERAGLVRKTVEGRVHHCEIDVHPMHAGLEWLRHYERWWTARLDILEGLLEDEDAVASTKRRGPTEPRPGQAEEEKPVSHTPAHLAQPMEFGSIVAPETVRLERDLPGPVDRLWSWLVDPNKRKLWFADGLMEPHVGGRVDLVWRNSTLTPGDVSPPAGFDTGESRASGSVTVWEPPHRLGFTWAHVGDPETEALFELTPRGDRVRLVVTHSRLVTQGLVVGVSAGWHAHLALLGARLEETEAPLFWATLLRMRAEYRTRYGF